MDVVSALKRSHISIAHLFKMKENDFDDNFTNSMSICEKDGFILIIKFQNVGTFKTFKTSSVESSNEQFKNKFISIIDVFIDEITTRFDSKSYEKLIHLYECFTNCDYNVTVESLLEELNENVNLFQIWDEFSTFSEQFGMYKGGRRGAQS